MSFGNNIIGDLNEKIEQLQAENKWLWRRATALENLGTCYRIGKRLTEKLLTELEKTKKALEGIKG